METAASFEARYAPSSYPTRADSPLRTPLECNSACSTVEPTDSAAKSGMADTLEKAKAAFAKRYEEVKRGGSACNPRFRGSLI
jgi:hypothetical protein